MTMKELIACCGINCELCEARIATLNDDNEMRKKWQRHGVKCLILSEIVPESINCTGCRMPGVKFAHCEYTCEIRKCVKTKGFDSCAGCPEIDGCQIVGFIFKAVLRPGKPADVDGLKPVTLNSQL